MKELYRTTQQLPVKLTVDELLTAGKTLGQVIENIATEESAQNRQKADMKATLSRLEDERGLLARMTRSGHETRAVETVAYLFESGTVSVIRADTGEEILNRKATPDELQDNLPFASEEVPSE